MEFTRLRRNACKIVKNTRKMLYEDAINYKKQMRAEQMKGMDKLIAESEALDLYD